MAATTSQRPLNNMHVVACGNLSSMTHARFAEFISLQGGVLTRSWQPDTRLIVQGENALGTRKFHQLLRHATRNGPVEVVTEGQLYRQLGLVPDSTSCRLFSIADVARLVKVSGKMLRGWLDNGFLQPHAVDEGVSLFRYAQLADARHIARLLQQGVAASVIRKALQKASAGGVKLRPVHLIHYAPQKLGYRDADGNLLTPAGDRVKDFSRPEATPPCIVKMPLDFDAAVQQALDLEQQGDYAGAAGLYEQVLSVGPADEVIYFNLGNVELARQQVQPAIIAYQKSLEIDPHYAEAWNNLGNAFCEAQNYREAIQAYRNAVQHAPQYYDAHFNLAETYLWSGHPVQARRHYLNCLQATDEETIATAHLRLDELKNGE